MQKSINNKISGYSLIEMAIVISIIGALTGSAIGIYENYARYKKTEYSNNTSADVTAAIGSFRAVYGRYPCPSKIDAAPGELEYGHEDAKCKSGDFGTTGTCTDGICTSTSANGSGDSILIGAVPYKSLGLTDGDVVDGYGNKITYAVTAPLTSKTTFAMDKGGIGIVDASGNSIITIPDSAHFVTISHGQNSFGAFSRYGKTIGDCSLAPAQEFENCDNDNIFSYGSNNKDMDDLVTYYTPAELSYWESSTPTSQNIYLRGADQVAIGASVSADLTDDEELKVRKLSSSSSSGIIHAKNSSILTNYICEYDAENPASDCFVPSVIGGKIPEILDPESLEGMDCGSEYLLGIQNGKPECGPEVYISCPKDSYVAGFTTNGKLLCNKIGFPFCTAEKLKTSCGTEETIESTFHGNSKFLYSGTCNKFDSTDNPETNPLKTSNEWKAWLTDGPKTVEQINAHIASLNSQPRREEKCKSSSYTSSNAALVRDTYRCNAGVWEERVASHEKGVLNNPFPGNPYSLSQPALAETSIPYSDTFDVEHANDNHDCWCREDLRAIYSSCGVGYADGGLIATIQKYKCPATKTNTSSWVTQYTNSSSCICDGSGVTNEITACTTFYSAPSGSLTGNVTKTYDRKCVNGVSVKNNLIGTSKDCYCPLKAQVVNTTACPIGTTNSFLVPGETMPRKAVKTVTINKWICEGTTSGGDVIPGYWKNNIEVEGVPPCTCDSSYFDYVTESCAPGQIGTGKKWKKKWDCSANPPAWEPRENWTLVEDNCHSCSWKSSMSPEPSEFAYGKKINEKCACGESGDGLCHDYAAIGYFKWTNCHCTAD